MLYINHNRCGPVCHFWSMRFESKHSYFKDVARRVKCFKNIPKTLATRHQQLMCYYLNSSNFFIDHDRLCGPGKIDVIILTGGMCIYKNFFKG